MYFGEQALKDLDGVDLMVLVWTSQPVAFFAYPDRPSVLVPEGCGRDPVRSRGRRGGRLNALADALGAPAAKARSKPMPEPAAPAGKFDAWAIGASIAGTCRGRSSPTTR
jgi:acetolactate synthase-1/2/3 large subunit